jgi:NAD(P)-dependent dehydrogenase (short-subunit alcohol dehydrogenase family)
MAKAIADQSFLPKNGAQEVELASHEDLALRILDLDVTDDASVERAAARVVADAERLDVHVNNAGYTSWGLSEAFTIDQAQRIFGTNFFGVVSMNRAVLPHTRPQREGLIIHITSAADRGVLPGMGLYTAAKFAVEGSAESDRVEGLADSYHYELSQLGIDSVTVEPGRYQTGIFGKTDPPADNARGADYGQAAEIPHPVRTALESSTAPSQEVADAVLRLIEPAAGHRPLRTLVGPVATSSQPINGAAEHIQREMSATMGLGHRLAVPAARGEGA